MTTLVPVAVSPLRQRLIDEMRQGDGRAHRLAGKRDPRGGKVAAYEGDMFARSAPIAQFSAANLARFFGPLTPTDAVELFASR
jgi:hypothetical protein